MNGARVALWVVLALAAAAPSVQSPAPNIVILFLDDAGYGDFGVYGHPTIRTPNIDRMAAEGMRFTQFYSASPACTASRYALLTGRLPVRSGFAWVLTPASPRGMHPEEWTLAEGLKAAGYATAIYGKWHLGRPQEYLPLQHGFDEFLGLPYSNDMQPPKWESLPLIEGNDVVELDPDQSGLTRLSTERSVDFIRRHADGPFFLYVPYSMPHLPLHPGTQFAGRSSRGTYGDVIEELDASIGTILATIRDAGIAEKTLVFFTSDNGPWIIKNEEGGSAGPFRDGKGSTWEGGMREPAIAWWPGTVPAGMTMPAVASTMDLYVTALQLAGQGVPDDRPVDGRDISALLAGRIPRIAPPPFFYYGPRHALHAVRRGPWKLHVKTSSQTGIDYFDDKLPLLFNLAQDPAENWDVAGEHPEIVNDLLGVIEAQQAAVARAGTFFDPSGLEGLQGAAGTPTHAAESPAGQAPQGYTPTAASAPSTDIYIGALETDAEVMFVNDVVNVTDRDGYDNQPAFEPSGTMLYTSARNARQTDIYRYDLDNGTTRQVTQTPASEFSATPLPSGEGFSSIHEGPGVQALWRYGNDGAGRGGILDNVQPVGYHAWADENIVVMFVLGGDGNPATLQVGDLRTGTVEIIAENPGRSLHKVPGRRAVSFVRKIDDADWWIEVVDFGGGATASDATFSRLVPTLPGREDYAWTPTGTILMGDGSKLFHVRPGGDWTELADLEPYGVSGITRLAVHPSGTRIAIVGNRQ